MISAVESALLSVGQVELLHSSGQPYITEPTFLLQAAGVLQRALVGEQAILKAAEEYHGKLESFG